MNEKYLEAEMETLKFSTEDVITTSGDLPPSTSFGGLGGENEGPAGDSFL